MSKNIIKLDFYESAGYPGGHAHSYLDGVVNFRINLKLLTPKEVEILEKMPANRVGSFFGDKLPAPKCRHMLLPHFRGQPNVWRENRWQEDLNSGGDQWKVGYPLSTEQKKILEKIKDHIELDECELI